jgi:hypothetical protein
VDEWSLWKMLNDLMMSDVMGWDSPVYVADSHYECENRIKKRMKKSTQDSLP